MRPDQGHRGYLADEILLQSVQPGVDNRQSVERTLGRPSFVAQFGEPVWYYVSSTRQQKPFRKPQISQHTLLAVHFDDTDNVVDVERTGMELVARIIPENDETADPRPQSQLLPGPVRQYRQVGAGAAGGAAAVRRGRDLS
jgi:outer membrane protein assembly factor BamE (lipoprotein component of BamABCDE complex)